MPHMEGIFINGEKAKFHPEDILDTDASQYTEEIGESVTAYLTEHLTNPSNPPIDTSLSIAGAAADAKETGDQINQVKSELSTEETARINAINGELTARKNADNILSINKINIPLDADNHPTNGTSGQMLRTNGDGSTEWVDEGLPTDEQTAEAVTKWLDEHPEATTTVQDGAITVAKLGSELQAKQATIINTYNEFVDAINDGNPNSSYVCKKIIVNNPVQLTTTGQCSKKSFSNGIFELNSNLFTWQTPSAYYSSPNFVGCTFIGNGNSIFVDGAYTLGGNFVNCNFIDCAFVHNGTFVQSPKFINCYFENTVNNTFIHTERSYEARFISCRVEAQNKAILIDAYGTTANTQTLSQITFANCVIEGQSNYVVKTHDCEITINNCYTEANSMPFVKVLATNRASAILSISITDTKIDMPIGTNFVEIDSTYENTKWSHFVCKNTSVSRGNLININNLHYFDVDGVRIISGGTRLPSKELSKVYPQKNSVIEFSGDARHCIVKKFPCLITFDSSDGGWHTNLYFVSLSHNNTPKAICLSDPTKTPSAVYDSETGYVDVALHTNRGVYENSSAVLLNGLVNDLIRNNAYDATYSGYSV